MVGSVPCSSCCVLLNSKRRRSGCVLTTLELSNERPVFGVAGMCTFHSLGTFGE
jgi:hypothetical protein